MCTVLNCAVIARFLGTISASCRLIITGECADTFKAVVCKWVLRQLLVSVTESLQIRRQKWNKIHICMFQFCENHKINHCGLVCQWYAFIFRHGGGPLVWRLPYCGCHYVSTVAQIMDLIGALWFYWRYIFYKKAARSGGTSGNIVVSFPLREKCLQS